jgi:hypothetical protein
MNSNAFCSNCWLTYKQHVQQKCLYASGFFKAFVCNECGGLLLSYAVGKEPWLIPVDKRHHWHCDPKHPERRADRDTTFE